MATCCALHVHTTDPAQVIAELREWLQSAVGASVTVQSDQPWPPVHGERFRSGSEVPSLFAVAPPRDGWTVAHFNCFSDLHELANRLSGRLAARLIVVNAQSVSDAYLLAVHEAGAARRVLEYGDRLTRNEGEPFDFEGEIFGVDDDELPPDVELAVGRAEVRELCARLGLPIWESTRATESASLWTVLSVVDRPRVDRPGILERLRRLGRWIRSLVPFSA